jgi:ADP-heptose:LPS heptosyltransferase
LRGEQLEFPIFDSDRDEFEALPEARSLWPGQFIVVHPGATAVERRWPAERFAAVADALAARGFPIVLTGTAAERPLVRAVAEAMRHPAIPLAGRTSLGALGVLLSQARLVLCNDTGVSHLADALRVPSVVVFGADARRWAPLDRQLHRVVAAPSGRVADVDADDVAHEVEDQLRQEAGRVSC